MPMSQVAVIPWEASSLPRSTTRSTFCSSVVSGIRGVTRLRADSRRTPVGSPFSSRSIWPPWGSGVSLVMPAISRALLFTQRMWPQVRMMDTGESLHPSSRS